MVSVVHRPRTENELSVFEARNSRDGLLLRYANGRVRQIWNRQIFAIVGGIAVASLYNLGLGVLLGMLSIAGDLIECSYLQHISKLKTLNKNPHARSISTVLAAGQGLCVAVIIWIVWNLGENGETHYFAMAILFGAGINSGLVIPFHKSAGLVRVATFFGLGVVLAGTNLLQMQDGFREIYDALAFALLAYLAFVFVQFANVGFVRRQSFERKLLHQKTTLEKVHSELQEESRRANTLALVAQHANDSVIISGPDRRIEWVNPAFSDVTGYASDEVLGKTISQLLNGKNTSSDTVKKIQSAIAEKRSIRTEIINYTKSGREIWIETNITPILSPDRNIEKIISVERDRTDAKNRERELALAKIAAEDSAKSKANFLATMSHEIRTPLNGIIGMAELLKESPISEEQQSYTNTIQSSGEALLQIINDILDLSKHDAQGISLVSQPFQIGDCVEGAVNLLRPLAQEKGLSYVLSLPPDTPPLLGDSGRLRQIVLNLVGNAIKFTNEGEVKVTLRYSPSQTGARLALEVKDSGIGISRRACRRIFDVFSQAEHDTTEKFGGSGLGLTISRNLARAMNGDITVNSEPGVGSCFSLMVELPYAPEKVLPNPVLQPTSNSVESLKNKTILVADDNKTNRLLINKMLGPHSANIVFAENGEEAIELFENNRPDLVLMDVSMPKKNGLEATRTIRALEKGNLRSAIIIALTANAFEKDRSDCLNAGMNGFMTKPFRLKDLLENVEQHLSFSE